MGRCIKVGVYLSREEFEVIEAAASARAQPVGAYLRDAGLAFSPFAEPEPETERVTAINAAMHCGYVREPIEDDP